MVMNSDVIIENVRYMNSKQSEFRLLTIYCEKVLYIELKL